jgi:hypothetical protein
VPAGGVLAAQWRQLAPLVEPTAAAVVEAAINALSAPKIVDGVNDSRTVDQRCGDALIQVCRRATADAVMVTRVGPKATVVVTIGLDDLRDRTRPGTPIGGLDGGGLLGPETVRKLACDGTIIPVLLGGQGQLLHLGAARRAFTSAQHRALWLRDRHCTFPGCTAPRHLVRRPSHPALGRRRRYRPDQRHAAVRTTSPSSTATASPPPSPPATPATFEESTSSGTGDPAATTRRWLADRPPVPRRRAVASGWRRRWAVSDGRGIQAARYCAVAWAARRTPGDTPTRRSHR